LKVRPAAAKEVAEKVVSEQKQRPRRLKPHSKQCTYRSAEALRHPKSRAKSTFSASCKAACVADSDGMAEAMPLQNSP
jgi:hypothetical protein